MFGSKNSKVNALVQIIDQEVSGAIDNINEGKAEDARAKLEYVRSITNKLGSLNKNVDKSVNKELKEFDEHIEKFSAS